MGKRYSLTFKFFDKAEQAEAFCEKQNSNSYIRKNHKATYTPWANEDKTENKFIAWYATK